VRHRGNPVVCENSKTGTDPDVWDIDGAGDESIQGFATDISVNVGSTVQFKIKTDAVNYKIDIYRTGWYGGDGARFITSVPSPSVRQNQPGCVSDDDTGNYDCGKWAVSASWAVPTTAVSGVYVAKLTDPVTDDSSHITFIVRNDASTSAVVFQTSDTTWQAYNTYGARASTRAAPSGVPTSSATTAVRHAQLGAGAGLLLQRRVRDGAFPRAQRVRRELHGGRRLGPSRGAHQEPQGLPVGRPRRVLVGCAARQHRGRPGRRP
jgi:hypothetical protein